MVRIVKPKFTIEEIDSLIRVNLSLLQDLDEWEHIQSNKRSIDALLEDRFYLMNEGT
jgi:hypothetical protein